MTTALFHNRPTQVGMTQSYTCPKQRVHEGICYVCAHRVSFFYRLPKNTRTSVTLIARLNEEAEERAKTCIIEGYIQGELNYEIGSMPAAGGRLITESGQTNCYRYGGGGLIQMPMHMGDEISRQGEPMPKKLKLTALQESYPYAECPDCGEGIQDDAVDGSSCSNCGHVFFSERKND